MTLRSEQSLVSRRAFVRAGAMATAVCAAPWVVRGQGELTLRFRTIADPDGWAESLRLKGDWLVFEIGDGVLAGYGEASHSNDDERCKEVAAQLFEQHYRGFALSLESLANKEQEIAALAPDFVTATAFSGLNQALYDLLAKREQVPVWRLFRDSTAISGLPLYTTINRALRTRSAEEYSAVVGEVRAQGFKTLKCAPFEAVNNAERAVEKAAAGLATLARLREQYPELALRVDFHERFRPEDFFALVPALERLELDWIEEPFAVGPSYDELRRRTPLRIAAGELFWGRTRFAELTERRWCDVIMPDMNGLTLCKMVKENIQTSHIPVILLTAKGEIENRIEGLEVGADSYIPKPFHPEHLFIRIEKLIERMDIIRKKFREFNELEITPMSTGIGEKDDDFFSKITQCIQAHLAEPEFNAETIADEVGMSKASLYKKVKTITGLTPHGLIKQYRLRRAAELLRNSDLSVSEVIYETGFNSRSYFYKSFNDMFQCHPKDYSAGSTSAPPAKMKE